MGLFGDPSLNPVGADPSAGYAEILARWRLTNNPPTVPDVHRDLLTDFESPIRGVGFFVKDPNSSTGVLKVAHGFKVCSGTPGVPSAYRGKTIGYVGDVVGGIDVNTFELDPAQLERVVAATRCADTPETHQQLLSAEPAAETLDPLDSTAQAQSMIRTRTAMHIPCSLVECVLGKDLTARQAFEVVWAAVQAQGLRAHTKTLMRFLMVATTRHSTTEDSRVLLDRLGRSDISDAAVLSDRCTRVLYQHLPSLADPQMQALISQVAQMNDHARLDRVDRQSIRDKAEQPTTVREKYQEFKTTPQTSFFA